MPRMLVRCGSNRIRRSIVRLGRSSVICIHIIAATRENRKSLSGDGRACRRARSLLVTMTLNNLEEVERWILAFGEHATVIAPTELKERVREAAGKVAQKYRRGSWSRVGLPRRREYPTLYVPRFHTLI